MKKIIGIVTICMMAIMISPLTSSAQIVVKVRPVAPKVKVVKPRCPAPGYVWISGEWQYSHKKSKYVWKEGFWTRKKGKRYVKGHWKRTKYGHKWVPGHWA